MMDSLWSAVVHMVETSEINKPHQNQTVSQPVLSSWVTTCLTRPDTVQDNETVFSP